MQVCLLSYTRKQVRWSIIGQGQLHPSIFKKKKKGVLKPAWLRLSRLKFCYSFLIANLQCKKALIQSRPNLWPTWPIRMKHNLIWIWSTVLFDWEYTDFLILDARLLLTNQACPNEKVQTWVPHGRCSLAGCECNSQFADICARVTIWDKGWYLVDEVSSQANPLKAK